MSNIQLMSKMLDVTAIRQHVLADNLANVNTPGFKRRDVPFRDMLAKAVQSGDASKLQAVQPAIVEDKTAPCRPDGNSVSMQTELAEMGDNAMLYQFATKVIKADLEGIRKAIKGR